MMTIPSGATSSVTAPVGASAQRSHRTSCWPGWDHSEATCQPRVCVTASGLNFIQKRIESHSTSRGRRPRAQAKFAWDKAPIALIEVP